MARIPSYLLILIGVLNFGTALSKGLQPNLNRTHSNLVSHRELKNVKKASLSSSSSYSSQTEIDWREDAIECDGVWKQRGPEIEGDAEYNYSGISVAMSGDGKTVAIRSKRNSSALFGDISFAPVRIFKKDTQSWEQVGGYINGLSKSEVSNESVSLSGDGDIVAISGIAKGIDTSFAYTKIFKYNKKKKIWLQLGGDISTRKNGPEIFHRFISLSNNGKIIGISDSGDGFSHSEVYAFEKSNWSQLGWRFDEIDGGHLGMSISLSDDGLAVAVGTQNNDGLALDSKGCVNVYNYDSKNKLWIPKGKTIYGGKKKDLLGGSVSLSGDGNIFAVASDGSYEKRGEVVLYKYNYLLDSWSQTGNSLIGQSNDEYFGSSIALSRDAKVIAIGNALGSTSLFAFDDSSSSIKQIGQVLKVESNSLASSMALSNSGDFIVIGSPFSNTKGTFAGKGEIYSWAPSTCAPSAVPSKSPTHRPSFSPSTSPTFRPSANPSSSIQPSATPSKSPSAKPSLGPSQTPSGSPTQSPSLPPSSRPSAQPSSKPSILPSRNPSASPTLIPTSTPSIHPSTKPSLRPTHTPSVSPSITPTMNPTHSPSLSPSKQPSITPTYEPSWKPSHSPTLRPSASPSLKPSLEPSPSPTQNPSKAPSLIPTHIPSESRNPSFVPSLSLKPSAQPSITCEDNSIFQFKTESGKKKACHWLNQEVKKENKITRKEKYCHGDILAACIESCGICSKAPTPRPTQAPSLAPSHIPTLFPSSSPSKIPSSTPSKSPTALPSSSVTITGKCVNDKKFSFKLDNGGVEKHCNWIGRKGHDSERGIKYCSKKKILEGCPKACGQCS